MDYNIKGTVNGYKKYQTIELRCIDFNALARSNVDHGKIPIMFSLYHHTLATKLKQLQKSFALLHACTVVVFKHAG